MKKTSRNFLLGYVRGVILGTLAAVVIALIGLMVHWQPERTVKRQEATLIDAIETKKGARFRRLLSNEYKDRWGFTVDDATNAMLDLRSQFIVLGVIPENEKVVIKGRSATVTSRLTLRGTPIGGGSQVIQEINRLKDPWVFTWKKQSFLPSSWRLVSIDNPAIPDNVWGYEPGSIRSMMEGN